MVFSTGSFHEPISHHWSFFITPENIRKTLGFYCFWRGVERGQWHEIGQCLNPKSTLQQLLKEEKLLIASQQWGSFFAHPVSVGNSHEEVMADTFWNGILKDYSKITVPLLDYMAGN